MATKPVSAPTAPSVTANRPSTLARTGAPSNLGGAIDSISQLGDSSVGEGGFSVVVGQGERDFYDQSPSNQRFNHNNNGGLPNPHTGVVDVTSQGFVSLIELRDTVTGSAGDSENGGNVTKTTGRLISRAVALYEASIESAAGNVNIRGETFSLTL